MFTNYDVTVFFTDGSFITVYFVLAKSYKEANKIVKVDVNIEGKKFSHYSTRKSL